MEPLFPDKTGGDALEPEVANAMRRHSGEKRSYWRKPLPPFTRSQEPAVVQNWLKEYATLQDNENGDTTELRIDFHIAYGAEILRDLFSHRNDSPPMNEEPETPGIAQMKEAVMLHRAQ